MRSITLPQLSITLDILGLIVVAIIFSSCLIEQIHEKVHEKKGSRSFLYLLSLVMLTLIADIVAWIGEGKPALHRMTLISATVASCICFLAILCFMNYLRLSLYPSNRAVLAIFSILITIGLASIALLIGNIFCGYSSTVNEAGHLVHPPTPMVIGIHLTFPVLSFIAILLAPPLARGTSRTTRFSFILYTICPVIGVVVDLCIHGLSMTYIGFVISILLIYTGIYRQKQRLITSQQSALMLSQINPHFMYNTLSTIAAMCDIEPRQAKKLTLEFSQYLRRNLTSLTSDDLIPFAQEMDHVECYLKIEKARFQECLNVSYSIQCKDFYVPPLSIQPIVENAVRHGITRKAGGGTVQIAAYKVQKYYVIDIRDDGVGFDPKVKPTDNRAHVGLENVSSRIHRMCGGRLEVRSVVGSGTRVVIIIPEKNATPKKEETHEHISR